MLHAVADEQTGNFFRFIHRRRTHEDGLTAFVAFHNLVYDRALFAVERRIHHIGQIDALHGAVGGDLHNVERVDRSKLRFFRFRRTRHTRKLLVKTEIVLEGNGRVRLIFAAHFHAFLCFDRLVQTVGISSADHKTARKFVHDDDFAVVYDIIFVELEKLMRFERLLNVVVEVGVLDLRDVVNAEKPLCLSRAAIGELHRFILAVDDIIPIARSRKRTLALGRSRQSRRLLFFKLRFVIRLFFEGHLRVIDKLLVFIVLNILYDDFLFAFLFIHALRLQRFFFGVFQIVVEAARERAHKLIHLHVQIGRFFALT